MKPHPIHLVCVLAIAILTQTTYATNLYLDPNGDDDGPGTAGKPWRTLAHATEELEAGDVLTVRGGTYPYAEQAITENDGTLLHPITVRRDPLSPNRPKFEGPGGSEKKIWLSIYNEYWIVEGLEVSQFSSGVVVREGGDHSIIRDCYFHDLWAPEGSAGVYIVGHPNDWCEDVLVTACTFSDLGVGGGNFRGEGVYVSSRLLPRVTDNVRIEGNVFSNCRAGAVDIKDHAQNSVIRDNEISDCHYGIVVNSSTLVERNLIQGSETDAAIIRSNIVFRNNILRDNGQNEDSRALFIGPGGDYNEIYHNTFYNNAGVSVLFQEAPSSVGNVLKNNIAVSSGAYVLKAGQGALGQNELNNNLWIGDIEYYACQAIGPQSIVCNPFGDYCTASACDAGFVSSSDLHLTATSIAVNAGATIASVTDDYDQMDRPDSFTGKYDLGAYEYHPLSWRRSVDANLSAAPALRNVVTVQPNPFQGTTEIIVLVSNQGLADVSIFDVAGRRVRTVVNRELTAGSHHFEWEGIDTNGNLVSAGIYFVRVATRGGVFSQRVIRVE